MQEVEGIGNGGGCSVVASEDEGLEAVDEGGSERGREVAALCCAREMG